MSGAIAVFVKTPGLSEVKTRLAADLGKESAEAFHLAAAQSVTAVVRQLSKLADVRSYFAVAEQAGLTHHYWQGLACVWQGEGGLGERMASIYQMLLAEHDYVLLVGADIPQMTSAELMRASVWLTHDEQARFAFAPSIDGGFWAFGGNRSVPDAVWTDVVYSQTDTGAQFFSRIEPLGDIKTLSTLQDVDESSDLPPLRDALLALPDILAEQQALISFLDALPINQTTC